MLMHPETAQRTELTQVMPIPFAHSYSSCEDSEDEGSGYKRVT